MSDKGVERIVGLEALTAMTGEATETEFEIILAVTEAVSGEGVTLPASKGDVDTPPQVQDNEPKGGATRWLKRFTKSVRSTAG